MNKIIVIVGPTGVGKTKLSIELAKYYNGEIINGDSMQIYKKLNIGTAKITEEEKEGISHHLFDIKTVLEEYSIWHYQKDCRKKIKEIVSRSKIPIIVGGTGLYIKSALYDYQLNETQYNNSQYESFSTENLYQKLIQMDQDIIGKINPNNRRRIINAIIYYQKNRISISKNKTNMLLYNTVFIGLTTNREKLYHIINQRVDKMIKTGLMEEVYSFYNKKIKTKPLLIGIGYKELYEYYDKNCSLEDAIENIKRNSRKYAKRQYTFFKHQLPVNWFETNYENFNETVQNICQFINNTEKDCFIKNKK